MSKVSMPLISVIMPVYNSDKYLSSAIESILNQTFKKFEFIIINDGSTDRSSEILRKYAEIDNRIRLIERENKGLIFTLNEAISISKGKFIARMDSDDISSIKRLELQLYFITKSRADICGCHYKIINQFGKTIDTVLTPLSKASLLLYLLNSVPFAHGSVLIRKDFLIENKLFYRSEARFIEDKDLWYQMYNNNAVFVNVNDFLFDYRDYGVSFSKINNKNNYQKAFKISKMILIENKQKIIDSYLELNLKYNELSEREKSYLNDTYFSLLFDCLYFRILKYNNASFSLKLLSFLRYFIRRIRIL